MSTIPYRFRYGLVAAVSVALFVGGVVSGAAGSPFLLGAENVAGTAATGLTTNSSSGAALAVSQDGGGAAIQATSKAGTAGAFTSTAGNAISATARGKDAYGLHVLNTSLVRGSGAALRASADAGFAIFATSNGGPAIFIAVSDDAPPLAVNSSQRVEKLNVDATDGWSLGCPRGTVLSQGLCFGRTPQAASSAWAAADACASVGAGGYRYRLPTLQQLRSARDVEGMQIDIEGEHTDSISASGEDLISLIVFDDGTVEPVAPTDKRAFRCVTEPIAFDASLIAPDEVGRYPDPAPATGAAGPTGGRAE